MWDESEGLKLWYDIRGEGTPIVFIHGWAMDHRDEALEYESFLAERPGYARIYLDLPGMGRSPPREWVDCQDRYLDVVLGFIDRIVGQQRFILAGTSAGAYLALGVIHRGPERIDGLMLKVPLIIPDDAKRDLPAFRVLAEDAQTVAKLSSADREMLKAAPVQRQRYLEAYRAKIKSRELSAQQLADNAKLEVIRRNPQRYAFSFDIDPLPKPFEAPTLIVCGRQDTAVGYRDAWKMLEYFPRATFAVIDRGDHGLPVDQEEPFRALVHDWLDRVEEMRMLTPDYG